MEQTNVTACKYILMTYEGNGNYYYDTSFNLKVPFRPNSNGQYQVTVNEVMFKNNEATLIKDLDYFEIKTKTYVDGTGMVEQTEKYTVNKDIYTYKRRIDEIIRAINTNPIDAEHPALSTHSGDDIFENIAVVNEDGEYITELGDITHEYRFKCQLKDDVDKPLGATISYSDNWAYVLNNMNKEITGTIETEHEDPDDPTSAQHNYVYFTFVNMRLNGPYIYVLDTPITSVTNTLNANNESYNIVALSYNGTDSHNSTIQMCSSMESTTNDLSNLRVRLLNDQYTPVKILEPMYIQLTVSNQG